MDETLANHVLTYVNKCSFNSTMPSYATAQVENGIQLSIQKLHCNESNTKCWLYKESIHFRYWCVGICYDMCFLLLHPISAAECSVTFCADGVVVFIKTPLEWNELCNTVTQKQEEMSVEEWQVEQQVKEMKVPIGFLNPCTTCYCNTVLQCLFSVKALMSYFSSDFESDINGDNCLGANGELARVFAALIREVDVATVAFLPLALLVRFLSFDNFSLFWH